MDPFHGVTGFVLRFPHVPLYIIMIFYGRVTVLSEVTSFRVEAGTNHSDEARTFILREQVCSLLKSVNAVSDLREQNAFFDPKFKAYICLHVIRSYSSHRACSFHTSKCYTVVLKLYISNCHHGDRDSVDGLATGYAISRFETR